MSVRLDGPRRQDVIKHYLAGGIGLLAAGLMVQQLDGHWPENLMVFAARLQPTVGSNRCAQIVQSKATVSRVTLGKLLTVPEGKSRAQIRAIAKAPYCTLPPLTVRVGETTERDVYPLAFKPDTWLVVSYEGNRYAGFDFLVH
jgi:hypothetical protein